MTSCPHLPPSLLPSLPPCFFFFFQIRSKAIGRTWTPLRPNDTFPRRKTPPPASAVVSWNICSAPEPRGLHSLPEHYITFVFLFLLHFFFFLPTAHPVSCIALLQSLFWARCEPGTHQQGSCHRRPPARAQPLWIQEEKDGVSCLRGKKSNGDKKQKNSQSYFSVGDFSFLSFLFFPVSYGV